MSKLLKPEKKKNGLYWRISVRIESKQEKLNLGYMSRKAAEKMLSIVDDLESLKLVAKGIPPDLAQKIKMLNPKLQKKLIDIGLVKKVSQTPTLKELFDAYCKMKLKTIDARSVRNYRSTQSQIENYFGTATKIDEITQGSLQEFISDQNEKAHSTIGNYLKRGSEAFNFAVQKKWIVENPFQNLPNRKRYPTIIDKAKTALQEKLVTEQVLSKLLACNKSLRSDAENSDWNLLFALLRWSGIRIAEALILRWDDIDFEHSEITIRGKRDGRQKASSQEMKERITPLWEELRTVLESHKNQRESEYVLNHIGGLKNKPEFDRTDPEGNVVRSGRWSTNLQTTFKKILKRNSITVFPQPFHAIRKFRINEMERNPSLRSAEIREWTGNSEATAAKHYSNVTREDRQRAVTIHSGALVEHKSLQIDSDQIKNKNKSHETQRMKQSDINTIRSEKAEITPQRIQSNSEITVFWEVLERQWSIGGESERTPLEKMMFTMMKMLVEEQSEK